MKKNDTNMKLILDQLRKIPIVQIAVEKTGISRASFYRWKRENPEFSRQADEAILEGLLLVNDLAESQLISTIKDKNLGGITFWLKHRHPAYGNKVEIKGNIAHSSEELTPEQEALVREAVKMASFDWKTGQKTHERKKDEYTPGQNVQGQES